MDVTWSWTRWFSDSVQPREEEEAATAATAASAAAGCGGRWGRERHQSNNWNGNDKVGPNQGISSLCRVGN